MAYEYKEVVEMTDHVSPTTIRIGIFLPDVVRRASFSTKERMDQTLKEYFKTMVSRGLRKVRKVSPLLKTPCDVIYAITGFKGGN